MHGVGHVDVFLVGFLGLLIVAWFSHGCPCHPVVRGWFDGARDLVGGLVRGVGFVFLGLTLLAMSGCAYPLYGALRLVWGLVTESP